MDKGERMESFVVNQLPHMYAADCLPQIVPKKHVNQVLYDQGRKRKLAELDVIFSDPQRDGNPLLPIPNVSNVPLSYVTGIPSKKIVWEV